jgi:hypothetical protein
MIEDNPLLTRLLELKLPTKDYAIFGSAIMYFHGLSDLGHDIDIIARGDAWKKACELNTPEIPNTKKGLVIKPFGDEIEIFSEWFPGEWNIDNLIDSSEKIDGLRVVGFNEVLRWKRLMGREKDLKHIEMIENYLNKSSQHP